MTAASSYDKAAREVAALRAQADALRAEIGYLSEFERDYRAALEDWQSGVLNSIRDAGQHSRAALRILASLDEAELAGVFAEAPEAWQHRLLTALLRTRAEVTT